MAITCKPFRNLFYFISKVVPLDSAGENFYISNKYLKIFPTSCTKYKKYQKITIFVYVFLQFLVKNSQTISNLPQQSLTMLQPIKKITFQIILSAPKHLLNAVSTLQIAKISLNMNEMNSWPTNGILVPLRQK